MTIEYRRGNLFDAPVSRNRAVILAHACSAQGVWGAGIAAQFKSRFPDEYELYRGFCQEVNHTRQLVGNCFLAGQVACLITSEGYGSHVDPPAMILEATRKSFCALLEMSQPGDVINMPKINSGLFKVPWGHTAAVLDECLADHPGRSVRVWELG